MTAEERAALLEVCRCNPHRWHTAAVDAIVALLAELARLEAERDALRVVAHAAMQVIAVSDGVVTWEIEHDALSNALRELGEVPS